MIFQDTQSIPKWIHSSMLLMHLVMVMIMQTKVVKGRKGISRAEKAPKQFKGVNVTETRAMMASVTSEEMRVKGRIHIRLAMTSMNVAFESFFAVSVEGRPLLRVNEYFIGFCDFFELFFGTWIFILVWMKLQSHTFVGFLDVLF